MVEPTENGVELGAVVAATGAGELLRLAFGHGSELLPRSRRVEAAGRERLHGLERRKKGAR